MFRFSSLRSTLQHSPSHFQQFSVVGGSKSLHYLNAAAAVRQFSKLSQHKTTFRKSRPALSTSHGPHANKGQNADSISSSPYSTNSTQQLHSKEDHRKMQALVRAWRQYGHLSATIDPLDIQQPTDPAKVFELKPSVHGLQDILENEKNGTSDKVFEVGLQVHVGGKTHATLTEIIDCMRKVYANRTAAQFYHLDSLKEIEWIGKYMESNVDPLTDDERLRVHRLMLESQIFDMYLHKKFPTTKRYGLEGSEAFIPVMDTILRYFNKNGYDDVVLGMPHRGRLNLLTGLFQYPPRAMFSKIQGNSELPPEIFGTGDVLSHIGITTEMDYGYNSPISLSLLNNPSHLEAVNPVATGKCRARIHLKGKNSATVLVHGDSAICSQGVVTETLQLSNLPHFTVGGTVHVIVNNQLGFTTTPKHYRSTRYSGDIGKMISAPIFTVNAEHIGDVVRVVKLATEYKCRFKKDVFVEIVGYRRYGHNELDESAFTQPLMYRNIRSRERFPDVYSKMLIEGGLISQEHVNQLIETRLNFLDQEFDESSTYIPEKKYFLGNIEDSHRSNNVRLDIPATGYDIAKLKEIGYDSVNLPSDFQAHPRLQKGHIEARVKRLSVGNEDQTVDWALSEALAMGSLLQEGYNVRLCGQDASRGTFSQRHFKFIDQETEARHFIFSKLPGKRGQFEVVSSPLSEYGVLGFEYGFSIADSKTLVIFENQFGDFQNCAQVIFDNFIANGEDKWALASGITCLLPHGMDGAGPDHSSSRVERYLQMCNGDINTSEAYQARANMYVVNPSTPAQYFHLLRRQMKQPFRKPLIVVAPKTLLRHTMAQSSLAEMGPGSKFKCVLGDLVPPNAEMKRLILCTGKIFYDLHKIREERGLSKNVAIIRIEELSPFPYVNLEEELQPYIDAGVRFESVVWAQEEHENQGAYTYVGPRLKRLLRILNVKKLDYVGRRSLSSSAVGNAKVHKVETKRVFNNAFAGLVEGDVEEESV